jgi:hypothetical protein
MFDASLLCFPSKDPRDPNRSSPRCPAPESTSVMRTSHHGDLQAATLPYTDSIIHSYR